MTYEIVPLELTPMELEGLSEKLIASHYENNYGGAVRRLNAITAELKKLDSATAPNFTLNGLKREELIAYNSMVLHELYFAGLGGPGRQGKPASAPLPVFAKALERDFGSVDKWKSVFSAMGKALGGGSGWVLLVWSPRDGKLRNQWAADHTHALGDGRVVLALDMYEHAYHMDYGARAPGYVDAYMRNIHWEWAEQRYQHVAHSGPEPSVHYGIGALPVEALRDSLAASSKPMLIDVRRRKAFEASPDMLPGAEYREPEKVSDWVGSLPKDREIIVYCVYGHNVSEETAAALTAAGLKAVPLAGGIASWRAIGGTTQPRKD
jgi:superoxide dismutase, Fe-Mn family